MSTGRLLCNHLQQNDPNDKTVIAYASDTAVAAADGFGHLLGTALRHNNIVSKLTLYLKGFLPETESTVQSDDEVTSQVQRVAAPFLEWIQNTRSLRTFELSFENYAGRILRGRSNVCLVELILQALAQNRSVTSLMPRLTNIPIAAWTSFFSTDTTLVSLNLNLDMAYGDNEADVEAAAQALALHPSLEVITLVVEGNKYRTPFFHALQSHPKLRHFTLSMRSSGAGEQLGAATAGILSTCAVLQHATFKGGYISKEAWSEIANNGLLLNPTIAHLSLESCRFFEESTQQFLDPECWCTFQHLKSLCLRDNMFSVTRRTSWGRSFARMVASMTQLQHLELDFQYWHDGLRDFFDTLASSNDTNASHDSTNLESLTIRSAEVDVLVEMANYLPSTARLLTLRVIFTVTAYFRYPTSAILPNAFRRGLYRNGSLQSVDIRTNLYHSEYLEASDQVYIDAITARNKTLPTLLQTPSTWRIMDNSGGHHGAVPTDTTGTNPPNAAAAKCASSSSLPPSSPLLPALCESAIQAPKMSPKNLLVGFLADTEMSTIGHTCCNGNGVARGKRVAAPDVADVTVKR